MPRCLALATDRAYPDPESTARELTRDSLSPSPEHDPDQAVAVHALEDFLFAAEGSPLPSELYGNLRFALGELELPL